MGFCSQQLQIGLRHIIYGSIHSELAKVNRETRESCFIVIAKYFTKEHSERQRNAARISRYPYQPPPLRLAISNKSSSMRLPRSFSTLR